MKILYFLVLLLTFCQSDILQSGSDFISYHVYGDGKISGYWDYSNVTSYYAGYITANIHNLAGFACVQMTSSEKTIYVTVVDVGGRGFDLNLPAFCELCGNQGGFAAGGCNVNWQVVDSHSCLNFRSGKTKPDCNLCPIGTTCGNPDPNRNMGVNWDTYCPQYINYGMRRCEMRIDGCTCYGSGSPPPANPPQNPPPQNPPPTTPCTSTTTYILVSGDSCSGVATKYGVTLDKIYDMDDGNKPCSNSRQWAGDRLGICGGSTTTNPPPIQPPPIQPPPIQPPPSSTSAGVTTTRCGVDWGSANTACGKDCLYKDDCPGGNCFAGLKKCVNGVATGAVEEQSAETNVSPSQNLGLIGFVVLGIVVLVLVVVGVFYWKYKSHPVEEVA